MENFDDLTYDILPPSWMFCFLEGCPRADECMLHLTTRLIPENQTYGTAVFPTALKDGKCEHFKPVKKIKAAYGFDTIFKEVKSKDEKSLRDSMKDYFGSHGAYYRYHNGDKMLTPEQQQWIIDLFKRYGYTENLCFDHYRIVYDFE